jgi:hypothetical protein
MILLSKVLVWEKTALLAIHSAPGATPMVSPSAAPMMVPMVWVPWP